MLHQMFLDFHGFSSATKAKNVNHIRNTFKITNEIKFKIVLCEIWINIVVWNIMSIYESNKS